MEEKEIECAGFTFITNFDSANLSRIEFVPRKPLAPADPPPKQTSKKCQSATARFVQKRTKPTAIEFPDFEFNLWTNPDCCGTEFENSNRTWFYFGVKGGPPFSLVKLNIVDLNKQSKMYSQGMAPVYKICPGRLHWERIRDKPIFTQENNVFTLSFKFRTLENCKATTYFAFTYPFSYMDLQNYLAGVDAKMAKQENHLPKTEIRFNKGLRINNDVNDAIYYHRETLCYSLENRNVDLITISSHHNITAEREPRIQKLFPDENTPRAFKFQDKKVVFISARVHPGETPSSFVFNGLLNLLVQKDDPIAILLRRQYVFKLIPMLNPDGVARGHYRTDTRGCNLNRYYLNPSKELQPSIYAARALIRYHHFGAEMEDDVGNGSFDASSQADPTDSTESECSSVPDADPPERPSFQIGNVQNQISDLILTEKNNSSMEAEETDGNANPLPDLPIKDLTIRSGSSEYVSVDNSEEGTAVIPQEETAESKSKPQNEASERLSSGKRNAGKTKQGSKKDGEGSEPESGLFLYVDMHGHASKKGIFMYGNHFDKIEDSVECMLLPKIMSVNSQNFHFTACNFTEKNMYLRDKRDGTSREGSGRVAVLRITGLVRSYTLECNYNTGRFVNTLPQCARDLPGKTNTNLLVPPKYSPVVFEEIGRSLGVSILDLTNSNPWSRIPNSEYHTLFGIRDWLRLKSLSESFLYQRMAPRSSLRPRPSNKSSQTQVVMGVPRPERVPSKILPAARLAPLRPKQQLDLDNNPEDSERKENLTTFSGTSSAAAFTGRKEPGPSHVKRSIGRVGTVLQAHRAAGPRTVRSLSAGSKKSVFGTSEKMSKFKQYSHKSDVPPDEGEEKRVTLSTVSLGLNCENDRSRSKIPPLSDPCIFKQNPKRLKISKLEEGNKLKISDWVKEDAIPGPSSSDLVVYSRLSRPLTQLTNAAEPPLNLPKKRSIKTRPQLSPLKYKKSLEKKRGTDTSRKKSKTLFKKAGKIVLTSNDLNKSLIDRKRRKN